MHEGSERSQVGIREAVKVEGGRHLLATAFARLNGGARTLCVTVVGALELVPSASMRWRRSASPTIEEGIAASARVTLHASGRCIFDSIVDSAPREPIRGDAWITVHAAQDSVQSQLPELRCTLLVADQEHALPIRGLRIDHEEQSCTVLWRAEIGIGAAVRAISVDVAPPPPSPRSGTAAVSREDVLRLAAKMPPTPFAPQARSLGSGTHDVPRDALARPSTPFTRSPTPEPPSIEPLALACEGMDAAWRDFEIRRVEGDEAMSRMYRYRIEARHRAGAIDPRALLGRRAALRIASGAGARHVHGIVISAASVLAQPDAVTLTLAPAAVRCAYRTHERLVSFHDMRSAVAEILGADPHLAPLEETLGGAVSPLRFVPPRERYHCRVGDETCWGSAELRTRAQGEDDLGFLSRLLEEAGLRFWVENDPLRHVVVVGDAKSRHFEIASGVSLSEVQICASLDEQMVEMMDAQLYGEALNASASWRMSGSAVEVNAETSNRELAVGLSFTAAELGPTPHVVTQMSVRADCEDGRVHYLARIRCAPTDPQR